MGSLELEQCDFFEWSEKSNVTVSVPFDPVFFFNYFMLLTDTKEQVPTCPVPEYFEMRTPRKLSPFELQH